MRWPPRNKKQAGKFKTDQELTDLVWREFPLYFANFDAAAAGYVDTLRAGPINADTLKLFNDEIFPNFDLRDSLPKITATTLVITGDDDFICGPVCAEEICAGIRGARMVVVGDAGHMLFVEQPQAFHDAMTAFLEES